MADNRQRKEFQTVQWLRFVAAFMVVLCHSSFYALVRLDQDSYFYSKGANGVVLFFVISGFVMIISSTSCDGVTVTWWEFAKRRFIRIVPLYWLATSVKVVALLFVASSMLHATTDVAFIVKSYFFIPARNIGDRLEPLLGVGWTLNFEMAFYALFCLSLLVRIHPIVFISPFLMVLAGLSIFNSSNWPDPLAFYADAIVLDFLLGMIAGYLVIREMFIPLPIAIPFVMSGLVFLFVPLEKDSAQILENPLIKGFLAFGVVYGSVSLEKTRAISIPRLFSFLGAASYSLYLTHPLLAPAVPALFSKAGLPLPYVSIVLSVIVALISGAIVYYFVERSLTKGAKLVFSSRAGRSRQVAE